MKRYNQIQEEESRQGKDILGRNKSLCKEPGVRKGKVVFEELKTDEKEWGCRVGTGWRMMEQTSQDVEQPNITRC